MSTIPFSEIPADNRVPIFAVEINNERASKSGPMPWKNLLIGQAVGAITGSTPDAEKKWRPNTDNTGKLVRVMEGDQADSLFGRGSQIALMAKNFLKNAPYMELYCLLLPMNWSNPDSLQTLARRLKLSRSWALLLKADLSISILPVRRLLLP